MCRHKGIGMNKPKKKKMSVPSLPEVKLLLSGYAPEPTREPCREPDLQRPEPPTQDAPPSPGAVRLKDLKRYAEIKALEARRVRDGYAMEMAQHAAKKRLIEACWRTLDRARPSSSYTVLEKREQKMQRLIEERLQSDLSLEMHRAANAEAHFEAECASSLVKDATIRRLKRMLRKANKS